jgi:hypothetical protein
MLNFQAQDEDLLALFSDLINDETERKIFRTIFSRSDEDEMFEELIDLGEEKDDKD